LSSLGSCARAFRQEFEERREKRLGSTRETRAPLPPGPPAGPDSIECRCPRHVGPGGFESSSLAQWFTAASHFWSVGPGISQTVFDGGLRHAQTDAARAAYDATVATYRQTALTSFQGVEDNLAALRVLEEENGVQDDAVKAARKSVDLTTNQYKADTVSYLNVITVQTIALTDEITAIQIRGRRMAAAVLLVQALGGGWTAAELPSSADVTKREDPPARVP
jgi:outer membrane protein TolC